jgi:hypothetical protein
LGARGLGDRAARLPDDLLVVGEVKRRPHRTGAEDTPQIVVPRKPLVVLEPPVGNPVHPRRIHVGQRPLLEPVQLVGANKVHLAGEHCAVAGDAEVVGQRRDGGGQLRGVVDSTRARGQQPGHHRAARRGAQRRGAERALEDDAVGPEPLEGRRADDVVAVGGQRIRGELVGDDEKDVGAGRSAHARQRARWRQ